MIGRFACLALGGVLVAAPLGGQATPRPTVTAVDVPAMKVERHTLPNGLVLILHENHMAPVVTVDVWYHVGSKNERPGRTGFAHLFEHLMFEGSEHHPGGYFPPLQQAGGLLNGSTNTDRTNYWEVVPTNAVDLALWMESDRMGYLLPAVTAERFETQRDVVLNERRQNYENRPYGMALMAISAALFPPEHPYHWVTIGAAEDIKAMRLDDVHEFFRTYYHPANASLAVAGAIETARALDLADRYFGDLRPGPEPAPVRAAATLTRERRLLLEDRVELPRVYVAWHSPAMFADGDAERAAQVLEQDDQVDADQDVVIRAAIQDIMSHPELTSQGVDFILIAKNLERVADHATNVAEDVILATQARNVKHAAKLRE